MNRPLASVSARAIALCVSVALAGCDHHGQSEEDTRTDAAKGRSVFEANCAVCHAADAKGGGPASLGLGVVPPDLTQLAKNNGGLYPELDVMSVIDGYYRRDHFNDPMPVFGDEDLGPLIQVEEDGLSMPIPADLLAVSNYLASIQES